MVKKVMKSNGITNGDKVLITGPKGIDLDDEEYIDTVVLQALPS